MLPLSLYTHAAAALVAGALAFGAAWQVQGWRLGSEVQQLKAEHAQTLRGLADATAQARDALGRYSQAVNRQLAQLDATHYQELTHAQDETRRLRACLRAGTCGVRIRTAAAPHRAAGSVPGDQPAGGLGDAALALDSAAAARVLDLRESVESDAARIAYLQQYAQACWRAGAEGAELTPRRPDGGTTESKP
jgi:hypothetical protein